MVFSDGSVGASVGGTVSAVRGSVHDGEACGGHVEDRSEGGEEGHVDGDEIRRCLEKVMSGGEDVEEMRLKAARLKMLVVDAAAEGEPSNLNRKGFVEEEWF